MTPATYVSYPMDGLDAVPESPPAEWLWEGYLGRGSTTLLTSLWKAGKTTLLTGLLQQLGPGGTFLGYPCRSARALVVSEESAAHWATRLKAMPVGPHARLMARPFRGRPTAAAWDDLIGHAAEQVAAGDLDLFVVDPLASFLPGRGENDAGTVLTMLQPLQRLAGSGAAVLILHHPRKDAAEEGNAARGSGALLGFVDVILELHRLGRLTSDGCRRRLVGLSRFAATPAQVYYQWDPATGRFEGLDAPHDRRFRDNWPLLRGLLAKRPAAATHRELLMDWPPDREPPAPSVLYEWLNRATEEQLVRRSGKGRKDDSYRYRLPDEADAYRDRGELPPLRDLIPPGTGAFCGTRKGKEQ